jgi:uncharacterized Zn-binding protein involved in type VI secretion
MAVTIKVNGTANTLVHKGSNGVSMATVPDVCKTPSPGGPVPVPYPNISQSSTLANGTSTVKADGMMVATKGSEFSLSNGDNAGVAGGVKSSTFMKESTWLLYSFDVKMDGKNACRLSDKKFHNHENTVNAQGVLQTPLPVIEFDANDFKEKTQVMLGGMRPPGSTSMQLTRKQGRSRIRKNRRAALKGRAKGPPGTSLDEFPFASSNEGGAGANVAPIDVKEQNAQGGKLSSFYQKHGLKDGDPYIVKVV